MPVRISLWNCKVVETSQSKGPAIITLQMDTGSKLFIQVGQQRTSSWVFQLRKFSKIEPIKAVNAIY
jgi:hypothetical protein